MVDLPSRFGPYEIISPLGAGGMGQVFRARDTRLQRLVAIKVLRDSVALDPDRQRRFALEAIAASALNHPNILTVYDVGAEGDAQYIVSELIEGEPLRTEMNRGRMPLKRAIEIAHQVAEGLAAAHEAGIVHRDLKPENVMVTADNRVKIVDFGLAKHRDAGPVLAGAPTTTQTAAGLIVGTVPYMSPEQARGGQADFRSDQFALGVMLYEMATSVHPFKRDSAVQTLSAIITDDPPDPAKVMPPLPVSLRWLLRRLLAKSPRERFAHTADLAADLRFLREHLSEATSGAASPVTPSRGKWPIWLGVGSLIAASALIAIWTAGVPDSHVHFERFIPFATDAGYQGAPAWSPDGKAIVYEAEVDGVVQIFTRTLGSAMRTKVTNSPFDCYSPTWSSDGYIYYHSLARDKDALWRVSPVGATPEMVIGDARQSAISPDGRTVFFTRSGASSTVDGNEIWYASPPDAEPRRFTRGPFENRGGTSPYLKFSPDGSKLLVWLGWIARLPAAFWEVPMPDGEPRQVLSGLTGPGTIPVKFSWLPDDHHVIVTRSDGPSPGNHLWLADTQENRLVPVSATPGNEGSPSVSPDGRRVAFTWEATDFDLFEVPLDGSPLRPFLSSTRNELDPAASPVNTQFAYVTDRSGGLQIWLQNVEGYLQQPLVTEADFGGVASMAVGSLAFSPDGTKIAFQRASAATETDLSGGARLWITSTAGGKPLPISRSETSQPFEDAPTWSPDGEWVAYINALRGQGQLMKQQVGSRAAPVVLLNSGIPIFVARPQWSPDGAWILCETVDGLSLVAPDGKGSRAIGSPGWFAYAWDTDSRRVYGIRATDDQHHFMLVSIDVQTGAERTINPNLGTVPQALQPIRGFSRLRGRGFLTSVARVRSDIYLIEGLELPRTLWRRLWPWGTSTR